MLYEDVFNLLMNDLLFEKVDRLFLNKLDSDIKDLRKKTLGKREKMKPELKVLKRKFISKLIKDNYNMLLDRFFPHLKRESRILNDDKFSDVLYSDPNNWEMSIDKEREFYDILEKSIRYFYTKNHQEYKNLRFLLADYLPSRSPDI